MMQRHAQNDTKRPLGWVKPTKTPQLSGAASPPKRGFHKPHFLKLSAASLFAFILQSIPVSATLPGLLEFEKANRSQFEYFLKSCKISNLKPRYVTVSETYYHYLFQVKNICIPGKRASVCETYAVNIATGECSTKFYIANHGYYTSNRHFKIPDELRGEPELQLPAVVEGINGVDLLFSTEKLMIVEPDM